MKTKHKVLLKLLGYSLILFAFGHQLLHGYVSLLGYVRVLADSHYHIPPDMEKFLYGSSMTIIAFYALIFSTPNISILKKAGILLLGTSAFFLTDLFFIQYVIFPQGQPVSNEDSPAFELYLCIKWLLPFLLWIIPGYKHLGELLTSRKEERPANK